MLVYEGLKSSFINDVDLNLITDKILNRFKEVFHRGTGQSEVNSWRESMLRMRGVLADNEIPDNAGVAIEFNIPHTSNRIDFLLSGYDKRKNRPANRPIFFCNKTQMDTRKCPWCKGKGCKRRAFIWNHRNMAHMEADFRACTCYGLHKCSQDNDD